MRIYIPSDSSQSLGGGFSFRANLGKAMTGLGHIVVNNISEAEIALIASTTMVTKETIAEIKGQGLKLIVRLDNVPRNSRNRNTGTSRLKSFSDQADEIVWQCQWSKDYLIDFIGKEGRIIYNAVDSNIFSPDGPSHSFGDRENVYLYSRYNRDETKNWEVAWYDFQLIFRNNPKAKLILVGQFSPEQVEYNFDFFRGEQIEYLGVIDSPEEMAKVYRGCGHLLAVYFNDCFSNTYLEALLCGMKLDEVNMSGGTPEMLELFAKHGPDYFGLKRMAKEYERLFMEVLGKDE